MSKESRFRNKVEDKGWRGTLKFVVIPVLAVVIMFIVFLFKNGITRENSYDQIDYIAQFIQNGQLNDFSNKIGMKDPETDIKWYKDGDKVKIEFGYMTMDFTVEELQTERCQLALGRIGITTKIIKTKDGPRKLHLYYNGKELERWVS